jgi:hypothetical protein
MHPRRNEYKKHRRNTSSRENSSEDQQEGKSKYGKSQQAAPVKQKVESGKLLQLELVSPRSNQRSVS